VHVRIRAKFSGRATLAIVLAATLALSACSKKNDTPSAAAPTSGQSAASSGAAGAKVKVAFVPKLQGIPYFEAMNAGGEEAAAALPIDWLYQGSTSADAAAQADIVSSYIQQKVDALFIAPNDADSMAPLIKQAADAGIKVGTSDTDAPNSAREVMVLMASSEGIGEANTDALMKAMGGKGKFAIVSCGETATQLNEWIAAIKSYTAAKYPDAEIVDTVYAGEDVAKATQIGTDLMNAHPDMTGMVGVCSTAGPGIAQAVQNAGKTGTVFTVGMGTPNDMKPYLENGAASAGVLWDAKALGYLTAWAGLQLAQGNEFQATQKVADGALENVTYDPSTKILLMGKPLTFDKTTVGNYNF
jgi:rhamnose transport system substrate-binding protein